MTSLVWIITGMILFGAMTAGTIRLWINKRRDKDTLNLFDEKKIEDTEN